MRKNFFYFLSVWAILILPISIISAAILSAEEEVQSLAVFDADLNEDEDNEEPSPLQSCWPPSKEENFARPIDCEVLDSKLVCIYTLPDANNHIQTNTSIVTTDTVELNQTLTNVTQPSSQSILPVDKNTTTNSKNVGKRVEIYLTREDYLYSPVQTSFYDIPIFLCHSKANCQLDNWYVVQRGIVEYVEKIVRLPVYSRILLDIQGFVYALVRDYAITHRSGLGTIGILVGNSINNPKERFENSLMQRTTMTDLTNHVGDKNHDTTAADNNTESTNTTTFVSFQSSENQSQTLINISKEEIQEIDFLNNILSKERLSQRNMTKAMEKAYTIAIVLTPTSRILKPPNDATTSFPTEVLLRPSEDMMNSIVFEIYDLRFLFQKVYIYYGYAVIPSRQDEFFEYCHYVNDYFESRLSKWMNDKDFEVICMAYEYKVDLSKQESEQQQQQKQQAEKEQESETMGPTTTTSTTKLRPNATSEELDHYLSQHLFYQQHFDVRNEMLKQTWTIHNTVDYFIFLDINPYVNHLYSTNYMYWGFSTSQFQQERDLLQFYRTRWLLAMMKPLLSGGFYHGLGISFLHCPIDYDPTIVTLPSILPYNFAISRETARLLLTGEMVDVSTNSNEDRNVEDIPRNRFAFYPDISKVENNMVLFTVLSSLNSAFCLDENVIVNYVTPSQQQQEADSGSNIRPSIHRNFGDEPDAFQPSYSADSRILSDFMMQLYMRTTRKLLLKNLIQLVYTKKKVTSYITDTLRILLDIYEHDESCLKIVQILQNQENFRKFLPEVCRFRHLESYIVDLQHRYETNILQRGIVEKFSKSNRMEQNKQQRLDRASASAGPRVAVITAIYGNRGYEKTLKRFAMQTVSTDFICFTDNPELTSSMDHQGKVNHHGWIIDRTPYHLQSLQDDFDFNRTHLRNSLFQNRHPFNIAKFYKTSFHQIPRIRDGGYDVVIWIDGTIRITDHEMSAKILAIFNKFPQEVMVVFEHSRNGNLQEEVEVSLLLPRYNRYTWQNIRQPLQNVSWQYESYLYSSFSDPNDPNHLVSVFPFSSSSSASTFNRQDETTSSMSSFSDSNNEPLHFQSTTTSSSSSLPVHQENDQNISFSTSLNSTTSSFVSLNGIDDENISPSLSSSDHINITFTPATSLNNNTRSDTQQQRPRNYDPNFWKPIQQLRPQYGVWCTCFIAFNMKQPQSIPFLKAWYHQIKQFTTQDQVSFAYLTQALSVFPYSLPDDHIFGNLDFNTLFVKTEHGQ